MESVFCKKANTSIGITCPKSSSKMLSKNVYKIDSVLAYIDKSFSVTALNSYTQILNRQYEVNSTSDFLALFLQSYELFANTKGAYNPTDYTYEQYWIHKTHRVPSLQDTMILDSLFKQTIFSGFMYGDSIYNRDTFKILLLDDYFYNVSFESILPGYKLQNCIALLNSWGIKNYSIELQDQVFFAKSYYNASYILQYNVREPEYFALRYKQNFLFKKYIYTLLMQSKDISVEGNNAVAICAYASALANTGTQNNSNYWRSLKKFTINK